jgi:hypothetical protein
MFVVAKINFFDNELTQELFDFEGSLYEAYIRHYMWDFGKMPSIELASIEEIQQRYFDADMMINILEMPA